MVYRSLGVLFSESGITIAFGEFHENAGKWSVELKAAESYHEGAIDILLKDFFEKKELQYKVALVTLHSELQDTIMSGALIAVATGLPVITDLPAIDIELGGNGKFYSTCFQKLSITDADEINKAICIAFMGILRWREEYNFLSSETDAIRNSIGGAIWLGQEA